jgi:hypothetical protein
MKHSILLSIESKKYGNSKKNIYISIINFYTFFSPDNLMKKNTYLWNEQNKKWITTQSNVIVQLTITISSQLIWETA